MRGSQVGVSGTGFRNVDADVLSEVAQGVSGSFETMSGPGGFFDEMKLSPRDRQILRILFSRDGELRDPWERGMISSAFQAVHEEQRRQGGTVSMIPVDVIGLVVDQLILTDVPAYDLADAIAAEHLPQRELDDVCSPGVLRSSAVAEDLTQAAGGVLRAALCEFGIAPDREDDFRHALSIAQIVEQTGVHEDIVMKIHESVVMSSQRREEGGEPQKEIIFFLEK